MSTQFDEAGLRTSTLQQLLNTPFKSREYLLEPWLRQETSVLLWAPTGVGKTMLSLSIALAVAGGGELLGWKSPDPGKVLIVDGEMHIEDLKERSRMLLGSIEGIDAKLAGSNITILARQYQDPDSEFPDLATEEGQDMVLNEVLSGGYDLVILDNFSTLAMVEDENSASAMNPILEFLMKMKQAKVACLLVHHSGKNGKSARGSSKLETTFEVIIGLHKMEDFSRQHTAAFKLIWEKYRGKRNEVITSRNVWLESDSEAAQWMYEVTEDELCARLVSLVRTCKYSSQIMLAEALGINQTKVSRLKTQAIKQLQIITDKEWDDCLTLARTTDDEHEEVF